MATRDGFDPTRHTTTSLRERRVSGWIQIATFLVTGAMTIAAAVGVRGALRPGAPIRRGRPGLLGGLRCQPRRGGDLQGRPVGRVSAGHPARDGTRSAGTVSRISSAAGIGFACLVAACFVIGTWFARNGLTSWAWFSRITGAGVRGRASWHCRPDPAGGQRFWCSRPPSCWSGPG